MIENASKVGRGLSLSCHFSLTMKGLYWQGEDLFKAIGEKQKCSCKHSQTNSESYLPIILLIHSVAGTAAL